MEATRHWRIGLLGLVVSLLAVYFILSQVNLSELLAAWTHVQLPWLVVCTLFLVLGLATRAVRWLVLLDRGPGFFWRAFHIMNVAYLVNGVLPLRMGEVARAYLASRAEPPVPVFQSISTIIVERLLDLLAVVVLVVLALAAGPLPNELRAAALFFGPVALVGFLALVFLASRRALAQRLIDGLVKRIGLLRRLNAGAWLAQFLNQFLDGLTPLTRPRALLSALGWTAISWAVSVIAGYALMLGFWGRADWAATGLFIAAAAFVIAVPAVPGNLGTYEVSIIVALQATGYGEPFSTASAFAITVHGVNLLVYAVFGVLGFVQEGISLNQLSRGVKGLQTRGQGTSPDANMKTSHRNGWH